MKVSVVMATFNRCGMLARSLPRLFDQDLPAGEYEVVVVVDGSTDGTNELIGSFHPRCGFQVIKQPNRGQTAALNAGVRAASGTLVLFYDDDLVCDRELLRVHVQAHSDGIPKVVFGPVIVAPTSDPGPATQWTRVHLDGYFDGLSVGAGLPWHKSYTGPNCSLPRALFLQAGGYDEVVTGRRMEDMELGLRLSKMGIRFEYEPLALTHHVCLKSSGDLVQDASCDGRTLVAMCRKHPEFRAYASLTAVLAGPGWRQAIVRNSARLPAVTDTLLAVASQTIELANNSEHLRRWAYRLLNLRIAVAFLRGAVQETGSWQALKAYYGRRLPVLLYHDVGPARSGGRHPELVVSPRQFAYQIRWLKRIGYTGISPSEWQAWRFQGVPLPRKPVLITFDDAYANIATHALPVLRRQGFSAGVFVITRKIGEANAWDGESLMTEPQIRYWAAHGIEFGGHSRNHFDLTTLPPAAVKTEVGGSAEDLSSLGLLVQTFAYPFGSYSFAVREETAQHFALAFTCDEGLNDLRTDPLLLRRTMVQPGDTSIDIALRAALGRSPLNRVRSRLRLRSRFLRLLRVLHFYS